MMRWISILVCCVALVGLACCQRRLGRSWVFETNKSYGAVTRVPEWAGMPSEWKFVVHSLTIEVHSKNADWILCAFQIFGHILVTRRNVLLMRKTFRVHSKWRNIGRYLKCILTALLQCTDFTSVWLMEDNIYYLYDYLLSALKCPQTQRKRINKIWNISTPDNWGGVTVASETGSNYNFR